MMAPGFVSAATSLADHGRVVSEASAILGLPNEVILPLNATHRSMCRFASNTSQDYLLVQWAILDILAGGGTQRPSPVAVCGFPTKTKNQHHHQGAREQAILLNSEAPDRSFRPGTTVLSQPLIYRPAALSSGGLTPRHEGSNSPSTAGTRSKTTTSEALPPDIRGTGMITVKFNVKRHGKARGQSYQTSTVVPSSTLVSQLQDQFVRENGHPAADRDTYREFRAFGHEVQRTWFDVATTASRLRLVGLVTI
ncbi:hypothetical protein B0T14DRAFT_146526 [Immersiella caudata]|uniref:Uncharacterized protein n=1 Tax=Immersiella caudata TaxID=314043 RepID=A0AA39X600_9PEZI|nr:hypothetical protein B0T14DRAFT_146526 [Immersiella caudata]